MPRSRGRDLHPRDGHPRSWAGVLPPGSRSCPTRRREGKGPALLTATTGRVCSRMLRRRAGKVGPRCRPPPWGQAPRPASTTPSLSPHAPRPGGPGPASGTYLLPSRHRPPSPAAPGAPPPRPPGAASPGTKLGGRSGQEETRRMRPALPAAPPPGAVARDPRFPASLPRTRTRTRTRTPRRLWQTLWRPSDSRAGPPASSWPAAPRRVRLASVWRGGGGRQARRPRAVRPRGASALEGERRRRPWPPAGGPGARRSCGRRAGAASGRRVPALGGLRASRAGACRPGRAGRGVLGCPRSCGAGLCSARRGWAAGRWGLGLSAGVAVSLWPGREGLGEGLSRGRRTPPSCRVRYRGAGVRPPQGTRPVLGSAWLTGRRRPVERSPGPRLRFLRQTAAASPRSRGGEPGVGTRGLALEPSRTRAAQVGKVGRLAGGSVAVPSASVGGAVGSGALSWGGGGGG